MDTYLQQEQVLMELFHYVNQSPAPYDCFSAKMTLKYLESCSNIFEKGLLSHHKISLSNQDVLVNIQNGYDFFVQWIDSLLEGTVSGYNHNNLVYKLLYNVL